MTIKRSKIRIILAFMALFLIQFAVLAPVSADLTEVETNKQGLNKTEPTDGSGGEPVDGADESLPWWKKALNKLDDIGDGLIDGWNKFKDWAVDEWNDAWDTAVKFGKDVWGDIEDFFGAIGDWFSENKWAQTLLGGILAAVIIIGVIALLVFFGVIAIPIGIVGGLIILAGALIGGFLYQWLAGDNYSFWGAFGFSLVGGILGYIGYATGAFAIAISWLRTVAWPAVMTWWRTAAWPWLRGRPAAIWGWMRGTAWPWMRGRLVALRGWFTGRAVPWMRGLLLSYRTKFMNFYGPSLWKGLALGPGIGAIGGLTSVVMNFVLTGEFDFNDALLDISLGALSGGLLGPIAAAGNLGLTAIFGLSLYGGAENFFADGIKEGEWTFGNFLAGFGMSLLSLKGISLVVDAVIKNELGAEIATKSLEEFVKYGLSGDEANNHLEKKTNLNPKDLPDPGPDIDQKIEPSEGNQNQTPQEQGDPGNTDRKGNIEESDSKSTDHVNEQQDTGQQENNNKDTKINNFHPEFN